MQKYTLYYRGGMPKSRQEANARQVGWSDWLRSLGDRLVDRGAPSRSIGFVGMSEEAGQNPTTGYSIVSVESLEEAMEIAQSCPIHREGGFVEVARHVEPQPL